MRRCRVNERKRRKGNSMGALEMALVGAVVGGIIGAIIGLVNYLRQKK